jgi:GTP-binding protein
MRENLPIVAIVGRTNVGKSSLTNALVGYARSIVAKESGTTRDSIFVVCQYQDQKFWLVDTAGLKKAEDDFEQTIQEQILEASEAADLILVTVEAGIPVSDEDLRVAKIARDSKKPVLIVVNKSDTLKLSGSEDLKQEQNKWRRLGVEQIIFTSAIHKHGLDELLSLATSQIPKKQTYEDTDLAIAFLGRPNVGKSSIFNALAKKQQAIVADVAGTTRDINSIRVKFEQKNIELLDTAGIRKPGKIEQGLEQFSVLKTLRAIQQSDVCVVLLDVNQLATSLDQRILGMVKDANRGLIIAISKWDTLVDKTEFSADNISAYLQKELPFIPWAPLIFTSSLTGHNLNKLFGLAQEIQTQRLKKIKTTELNKWLRAAVAHHAIPPAKGNLQPTLQYAVQEQDTPYPSFQLYGNHTRKIHWSYKRYLEKSLRQQFDFNGTPLEIWFMQKEVRGTKKKTTYKDRSHRT